MKLIENFLNWLSGILFTNLLPYMGGKENAFAMLAEQQKYGTDCESPRRAIINAIFRWLIPISTLTFKEKVHLLELGKEQLPRKLITDKTRLKLLELHKRLVREIKATIVQRGHPLSAPKPDIHIVADLQFLAASPTGASIIKDVFASVVAQEGVEAFTFQMLVVMVPQLEGKDQTLAIGAIVRSQTILPKNIRTLLSQYAGPYLIIPDEPNVAV